MPTDKKALVKDQYFLRASFFSDRLESLGFLTLFDAVTEFSTVHKKSLNWDERSKWGITDKAWAHIAGQLDPVHFFVHPNTLAAEPKLLRYYRCANLLPQKGLTRLTGVSPDKIETGKTPIPTAKLLRLVNALNEIMSFRLEIDGAISDEKLKGAMYATAGVMLDGSWRNSIGVQGERVVRSLLMRALAENLDIDKIIKDDGTTVSVLTGDSTNPIALSESELNDLINDSLRVRRLVLSNSCIIIFKSEPDIEIRDTHGTILGAVEVKAGLDPAGALERLGAMLKSFDNVLAEDPEAQTMLVLSCLTPEVNKRILASNLVHSTHVLTNLTTSESDRKKFITQIRKVSNLIGAAKAK